MKEPPDHTAVFSAENLLSPAGLAEQVLVLTQAGIGVEEQHALLFQVLANLVVNNFTFVLRRYARNKPLLLGFRYSQLVVGVADIGGQVVPAVGLLLGRAHEVLDVV